MTMMLLIQIRRYLRRHHHLLQCCVENLGNLGFPKIIDRISVEFTWGAWDFGCLGAWFMGAWFMELECQVSTLNIEVVRVMVIGC